MLSQTITPTSDTKSKVITTFADRPTFSCARCAAVIALQDEIISKAFSAETYPKSLVHSTVNLKMGKREDRPLMTGVHTVADVFCMGCNDRMGWYYHKASDHTQKYKEGKYLLEREKLVKENKWTLDDPAP
ncbi:yippee-domain-containing protein [Epithele typhae]|uniref:yippee-domain-containing protein n=1 Tax=Epithele typhae TaxID=378194 RepID=UPI002007C753|nr:yippee-domain-containing protein [Epithele typhae]KAH9942373.1 yippee-domain-containing protein [Epithele typhae]